MGIKNGIYKILTHHRFPPEVVQVVAVLEEDLGSLVPTTKHERQE